ncbi:MAG: MATE family efflux transporter [Thiothrix nivea]|nr:MAG: MATE family efflux transporter [Thiothrix nivea]
MRYTNETDKVTGTQPRWLDLREVRQIILLAFPLILAQLVQMALGVVDTIMAGRIDALALAAIALGSGIWSFAMLCGIGLMLALPPTISQHIGANNHRLIREELRQGIWLSLMFSVVLMLLIYLIAQSLSLLGVQEDIIPEVQSYLLWISWSMPFTCLYMVPRAFNESMGNTVPMLWVWLVLLPLNALGNYVFMFGHFGFPALGAPGAGLSSGIVQVLAWVLLVFYTLKTPRYRRYDLARRMTLPDWEHIRRLFSLGFPICIALAMEAGMFMVSTLLMGRFGAEIVAGHQIALNVSAITFMVPLGIAQALTVRVGRAIGAGDMVVARHRGQLGITMCGGLMLMSGICLWLFGYAIAALYTPDQAVVAIAAHFLVFAAFFQLGDGLQIGASGVLRGYKDTRVPMVINTVSYWLVGLASGVYLSLYTSLGADGLWLGIVIGLFIAAVTLNGRFYWLSR